MSEKDNNTPGKTPEINESFLYSVNHATADDISRSAEKIAKKKKEIRIKNIVRYVAMGIFLVIFIVSLFFVIKTLHGYKVAEEFYADMYNQLGGAEGEFSPLEETAILSELDSFGTINSPKGDDSATYNNLFAKMKSRIVSLREINPDVYGWIIVPGTENIDYPILQGADNDYYLNHEYTYGKMQAGSIFADYRCDKDLNGNYNFVIYGHNMQNGMMFSELIKFLDKDFFDRNQYVYIYTDKGIFTYQIFSVYKTDYQYKYIETGFPTAKDFLDFANEMKANSKFRREGIAFNENSRILTLSTCTNGLWSDRYCVQAVMVDSYNEP